MNSRLSLFLLLALIFVSFYHLNQINYVRSLECELQNANFEKDWLEKQIAILFESK